ncbi:alkyl hydroperoxide reductase subunit F [Bowdeniella nasicola]|uniref:Alkyl hydroperoxide reductase subunit F n=1 Tax=Bowdeniella nasicola TaxID=208480 RepID=A0A1Q5Q4E5_9ACTO|nr:alkyl hydroperoxide reductase subunit F [Bowdeniella nasicola]OKL54559.1 alkyl hydroperoxide reductase subunit F [Bowdeniella nasicola]
MPVLNDALTAQLKQLLTNVSQPIELLASLDDSPKSAQTRELLTEIAALSDKVSVGELADPRTPSFLIRRVGTDIGVRFAGLPLGHEFTSLVLALLQVGGHPPKLDDKQVAAIQAITQPREFVTYMSLTCTNCPDVVQALNAISVLNPKIRHTTVEGGTFQDEIDAKGVMAVPATYEGDELISSGRAGVDDFIALLDTGAEARAAAEMSEAEPYDVLIVGGGPAASAAAIYAARKGIRTGMVTDRRGGQVLDTMSIENHVSVTYTEGPRLAEDLKAHVDQYGVDVYTPQLADALIPAGAPGELHEISTTSGGRLRAKAIILATGASWRLMGVPGENEYRNKGVSFCPHCDGPLFKGKRIAVVGGGNSGIEAAIDLAGVTAHVTVLEFMDELKADQVLIDKLHSLPNTTVITGARTTEVRGDGDKVTGLSYEDRASGEIRGLDVDGVFVQIGLMPNTAWLTDTVTLSDRGEIVIDERGHTNVPGVFAAGDCTTVPYKQIVIAYGAGSTAALAAFDHLIRS